MGSWRWRSRLRWPPLRPDPRAVLGLGLCGLAWGVAIAPQRQPLEGSLRASALSFGLQTPEGGASRSPQGFLVVRRVRSLTIREAGQAGPLVVPFRGQRLSLAAGRALAFSASAAEPLELRIALPPGTRVQTLQPEGKDQLVLDLLPPAATMAEGGAAELTVIPPLGGTRPEASGPVGLQVVYQESGQPPRRLTAPEAQFMLPLAGGTRLRLQHSDPSTPLVFEPNLRVSELQFTSQRQSLFDQSPLTFSTLRSGLLHLGRMDPLSLRPDQFLQIDAPGITVLTSLRAEQGQLALEVVGETQRIRSGLSQMHPTTVLQGTLLSRYLSPAQISGFHGFLVGVISSLVLTLFKAD